MIAIIDDGIAEKCFKNINKLDFDLIISFDGKIKNRKKKFTKLSHGTICSTIIKKYAPNSHIGSIDIFGNGSNVSTLNKLILALEWCLANNIKMISISVGLTAIYKSGKLQDILCDLSKKGVVVFAAYSNDNIYTLPACSYNVFGVKSLPSLKQNEILKNDKLLFDVPIIASSKHCLYTDGNASFFSSFGNSYACAFATGYFYNQCEKEKVSATELLSTLKVSTYNENSVCEKLLSNEFRIAYVKNDDKMLYELISHLCNLLNKYGLKTVAFYRGNIKSHDYLFEIPNQYDTYEFISIANRKLKFSFALIIDSNIPIQTEKKNDINKNTNVMICTNKNAITLPKILNRKIVKEIINTFT